MENAQLSGQNNLVRSTAQADAPVDAAPPYLGPAARPSLPVVQDPPTEENAPSPARLLRSVWKARGLFGGLIAIAIAYYGQSALLERNDAALATQCYAIAIVILVLSLLHPTLPWRRDTEAATNDDAQDAAESAQVANIASENGQVPTVPDPPASAPEGVEATPSLPTRKAGSTSVPLAGDREVVIPATGNGSEQPQRPRFEPWVPGTPDPKATTRPTRVPDGSTSQPAVTVAYTEPTTEPEQPGPLGRLAAWRANLGWRFTASALLVAVGLLVASFLVLRGNIASPLGGWLWAGGLVALLVALLGVPAWPRGKSPLPGPKDDFFGRGVPDMDPRLTAVLIFLVLIVAVTLRLYNLEYHPGIFGDEGERGIDARNILHGNNALIFGSGWWAVPNLYFYLTAFFLGLLGDHNMVADRMLSVVSGVIAVWYVYRTGKLLWGPRVGLIAGALMAVSPLALQFSRLAGESTPTGTLWAVGFFYLVLALRDRKWTDWLLSGLAWGFSLYFYAAGKLIIPLAAALGFYCLVRWRLDFFKRYALGFALLGVAMIVTAMPYILYAAESNFMVITSRAQETSIFSPGNQGFTFQRYNLPYDPALGTGSTVQSVLAHPAEWARLIYEQGRETLDVLYRRADQVFFYRMTDHGGTMFPPFWAAIVMLSLAYATWKVWDSRFGLVWIWFWFGMLGSILTIDTPNLQRVTGAWPALMLLPAALLDRIFAAGWPLSMSFARRWATIPLVAAVAFFGYTSIKEYFVHFVEECPYCDTSAQARYALDLGQDYKAYQAGVGGYPVYFSYGSTRFLAKDTEGVELLAAADKLPIIDNNGKGAAFIIYQNNAEYLPLLRLYYPGGNEEAIRSPDGKERFVSYKVTREQLATFQVARATYRPASGDPVTRDEPNIGTERVGPEPAPQVQPSTSVRAPEPWTPPAGLAYPLQATWEGGLVAPQYGTYSFLTDGNASDVKLEIDGQVLTTGVTSELVLARGVHEVRLSGTLADANAKLRLLWAGAGAPPEPVQPTFLYKGPSGGLTGEVGPLALQPTEALKVPNPFEGQEVRSRRVDPFIGFRETFDLFGSAPYLARWYGTLNVEQAGMYAFTVATPNNTVLTIDDNIVIDGIAGVSGSNVELSAGPHKLELRYASPGGGARIELFWTPPGGAATIIPPTVLTPDKRSWPKSEMPNAPGAQVPQPQPQPQPGTPDSTPTRSPKAVLGADAGLKEPRGLAVDNAGNMYIGDKGNHRVVVLGPDGKVLRTWGGPLPENAKPDDREVPGGTFGNINDIAVAQNADGTSLVYVLDSTLRVQVFTTDGKQVATYPSKVLAFYGANGAAVGPASGNNAHKLYITVTGQNRVAIVPSLQEYQAAPQGTTLPQMIQSIVGSDTDKFEQPVDSVPDPTNPGILYSIDLKDRIIKFQMQPPAASGDPPAWRISNQWPVPVGRAEGGSRLAISPDGKQVYMSDPDKSRVAVINTETGQVSYFGNDGKGEGQFIGPSGIAVTPDGTIYVLERINNRVQVFSPTP